METERDRRKTFSKTDEITCKSSLYVFDVEVLVLLLYALLRSTFTYLRTERSLSMMKKSRD